MILEIPLQLSDSSQKHTFFVEMDIFEEYKAKEKKLLSLKEIIQYDITKLKQTVFIFAQKFE